MEQISTNSLLDFLENPNPICKPKSEKDLVPKYHFYGLAPFWTITQAACLLSGLPTIDHETVAVLTSLDGDCLRRLFRLKQKDKRLGKGPEEYTEFVDYVAFEFPIQLRNTILLSKIRALLQKATKNRQLSLCPPRKRGLERILVPTEVIEWAYKMAINIPKQLAVTVNARHTIDYLSLPSTSFPDEVQFSGPFTAEKIKRNQNKPQSLSSLGNHGKFQAFTIFPDAKEAGVAEPSKESCFHQESGSPCLKSVYEEESTIVPELSSAIRQLMAKTIQVRQITVERCLQMLFPEDDVRAGYLNLIEKFGYINPAIFAKCKKLPQEFRLIREHRCRAVGATIRHTSPSTSIQELHTHNLMTSFGYAGKNPPSYRTFRRWMNNENIKDK